jgi:GNAT superfamily N-acetyltransferase
MPTFVQAHPDKQYDEIAALHFEYFGWVSERVATHYGLSFADAVGVPLAEMIRQMVRGLARADSVFYLIKVGDATAGMGGLGSLGDGGSELVRVYVRPEFRGAGLAAGLVDKLVVDASAFGFANILLTSARFMTSAHRIYETRGFVDRPPYNHAGIGAALVPHLRFMEKTL